MFRFCQKVFSYVPQSPGLGFYKTGPMAIDRVRKRQFLSPFGRLIPIMPSGKYGSLVW